MGATCGRVDCFSCVEDCGNVALGQKPRSLWYEGDGQSRGAVSSTGRGFDIEQLPPEYIIQQDEKVNLTSRRLAVSRRSCAVPANSWRRRYCVGKELGAGQTAVVFEAFTIPAAADSLPGGDLALGLHGAALPAYRRTRCPQTPEVSSRRVALKCFNNPGSSMFRHEVQALIAAGEHPHIVRLLESYEGGPDEDVLVLEFCECGDVYDLYASNNGVGMPEDFVVKLLWQLLLALDHIVSQGVEHRDVKPENMLLFSPEPDSPVPHLKLGDFGWAVVTRDASTPRKVPPEGVGSLWYAPPELSPPVKGLESLYARPPPLGASDIWSVGIVAYLLLVGHSPFNLALRIQDPGERENEVIRRAAYGEVNTSARSWPHLSEQARGFVTATVQPHSSSRPTAAQAMQHEFMMMHKRADAKVSSVAATPSSGTWDHRSLLRCLDGYQRLGWLAVARAITEPELMEVPTVRDALGAYSRVASPDWNYLEWLSAELVLAAMPGWFSPDVSWYDVLYLAFRYLDADGDSISGVSDLVTSVEGSDVNSATATVQAWVKRWKVSVGVEATEGLNFAEFRRALWMSCLRRDNLSDSAEGPLPPGKIGSFNGYLRGQQAERGDLDTTLLKRLQAIDDMCEKLADQAVDEMCRQFDEAGVGDDLFKGL